MDKLKSYLKYCMKNKIIFLIIESIKNPKKFFHVFKKKICVFCGASNGFSKNYVKIAKEVGEIIGKNNFDFI